MSRNIVFEGWLTKSPPSKRIWRTKWRRRWFALRQSGELPGQYFLDYYADRNCRRLKGTINLDLCEQVDAGLHMERAGNGTLDPKLRGSVFTIQTQSRTYHLEADCEAEMAKWVEAICGVCGLRSTEDEEVYQYNPNSGLSTNEDYGRVDITGPYIPISECITGVRNQGNEHASQRRPRRVAQRPAGDAPPEPTRGDHVYINPPRIRITDLSENESNVSEDDCPSLNANQSNHRDNPRNWNVTQTFTRLTVNPNRIETDGPPVPPRPLRTLEVPPQSDFYGARAPEPVEPVQVQASVPKPRSSWVSRLLRLSHKPPPLPPRRPLPVHFDERTAVPFPSWVRTSNARLRPVPDRPQRKELPPPHSMQYYNLPPVSYPPAVDRALKPRYSSHSIGHDFMSQLPSFSSDPEESRSDTLQYLDLDLPPSSPPSTTDSVAPRKVHIIHGKSMSDVDTESAYKTVDFLKTEAFNSTRREAEDSRSYQC